MAGRSQAALRASRKNHEQAARVLELKRRGLTFSAIGARLGISDSRAHQVYWKEIHRLTDETRGQAIHALTEVVQREEMVVAQMAEIVFKRCPACDGQGCTACATTGHLYEPTVRISAVHAIQRSNEHFAKLFDLHHHRVELSVTRDFLDEVEQLSDDQLEREIEVYATRIARARLELAPAVERQ